MPTPFLDQETLRKLLIYYPGLGDFMWRTRSDVGQTWNTRYAGKAAGFSWTAPGGVTYRSIRIFDWPFLGHRLAFLYMTGEWPTLVDHIDGNGMNNRWANLRLATRAQNAANSGLSVANKTGFKGVCAGKAPGRYRATIRIGGKQVSLGTFDNPEAAARAYRKAATEHHGEYARLP